MNQIKEADTLISLALTEDLGKNGDVTSSAIFSDSVSEAAIVCRDTGVLAGEEIVKRVYSKIDPEIRVLFFRKDGENCFAGEKVASVSGNTLSLLKGERIALNFLSYLSGIASLTHRYVQTAKKNGKTLVLDTRKTLPGYRNLAKYAVRMGGGTNHRIGLYDMVMIKDNHIDAAGSITEAVNRVRQKWGERFRIEVECRNLKEVQEACQQHVDIIMLDNMNEENVAAAVKMGNGIVTYEASGDMDLNKVDKYSKLGLDYISVGKLTHSVSAFNFSLQVSIKEE